MQKEMPQKIQNLLEWAQEAAVKDIQLEKPKIMTSANVTNYRIFRNGEVVGNHSQHHMCHPRWHQLFKFQPYLEFSIQAWWLDEYDNYHEGRKENLKNFMDRIKFSHGDVRRLAENIEKQQKILQEWVDKFGDQDRALRLTTLNAISYSPL